MMGCAQWLRLQFGRPTGFWGTVAGMIMAHRRQNRERNVWTVALLDIQRGDRVLEIGFGPGLAIQEITRVAPDALVAGIDHSAAMVRQAQKRNAAAIRNRKVDVRLGSVASLPAFDESFDKCFAVNAFQFWNNPIERLKELRGLLKPGGLIAITEEPRSRKATDETAHATGREIVEALTKAGFSQVRLETKQMKPVSVICALGVN